jgi:signal transduction histidine kinase
LNGVGVALLLVIDSQRLGERSSYGGAEISLFALVFVISAFGSVLMAARIRALLVTAALDSVRIESARWSMAQLLRQHHDARTLLSAVNVNAELVREALRASATGAAGADDRALAWADAIRTDLAQVNASILNLGEQTFAELASLGEPELADTSTVLPPLLSVLSQRFLATTVACDLASLPYVRVAGGPASLQRIVYNLLLNAVEGDGTNGARRVWVSASTDGDRFLLRVEDDGPGFPSAVLAAAPSGFSTKPTGTGLGLYGVSRLVASSDGQLLLAQREPKGAAVTVLLPLGRRAQTRARRPESVRS